MNTKRKTNRRIYCEDVSPTLNILRKSKHHGNTIQLNGLIYERIGDNLLYCEKTSLIKNLDNV
jgi:hypothetical protein